MNFTLKPIFFIIFCPEGHKIKTYATQFLRNGGDLLSLQRLLGHADLQTTAIYLHWTDGITAEANKKYNPLDNFRRKKFFI